MELTHKSSHPFSTGTTSEGATNGYAPIYIIYPMCGASSDATERTIETKESVKEDRGDDPQEIDHLANMKSIANWERS